MNFKRGPDKCQAPKRKIRRNYLIANWGSDYIATPEINDSCAFFANRSRAYQGIRNVSFSDYFIQLCVFKKQTNKKIKINAN